jgi:molecular chaperone GrpE (heat shock protein)
MNGAKKEIMSKASNPTASGKPSKKTTAKKIPIKSSQPKLDFSKWLDLYAAGNQLEKLNAHIPQLNSEFQNIASELVVAISGTRDKPTTKFKIEKLPYDYLKVLRIKMTNPFFLITLLCNSISDLEVKKLIIGDLSKISFSADDVEYLLNKLAALKDPNIKRIVWNEFLANGILLQEIWKIHQLRFLDWGFSHGLHIDKPIDTFIAFRSASDQFKILDTPLRNKVYRKLLELDVLTFVAFLLHISSESLSPKFIEQIIGKKSKIVLLTFLDNRQSLAGPWLDNFERQFIAPILRTTLDSVMHFEDLLPFIVKQSNFSHLIPADTLPRAVSRSFKRNDDYSKLLSDIRVENLNRNIEELLEENAAISSELANTKSRSQEQEKRIKDFESAIENYESRLRSQMKSENLGSDALSQNAKAELLKNLVESLDHLLQEPDGFPLERALQKIGVARIGDPGSDFAWDSELCETLTGSDMEKGVVVRSGYTWLNAEKKVVIRRVLLK